VPAKTIRAKAPTPPLLPQRGQLDELYDQLLALPNVTGCFIGHRRRNGRRTSQLAIVACVSDKVKLKSLSRQQRVPRRVAWSFSSKRKKQIPVDVQVVSGGELHTAVLGAGDEISGFGFPGSPPRPTLGTVGIAMQHPLYGRVVTTAAHVFVGATPGETVYPPGQEIEVSMRCGVDGPLLTGHAHKVAITQEADYAIISPPPGIPAENLYHDSQPLGPPYVPQTEDLDRPAYMLGIHEVRQTYLRGYHGRLNVGGLQLIDVLLTDPCTTGGDSGGCLVNQASRPMGLVEGATMVSGRLMSVFTSVVWPMIREQATTF
jgi:hypothetical protein